MTVAKPVQGHQPPPQNEQDSMIMFPACPGTEKQNAAHKRGVCAPRAFLLGSVCTQLPAAAAEHLALDAEAVPGG